MNVSDVVLECSRECARLSRQCGDEEMAAALFQISARLFCAATHYSELITDDTPATPLAALRVVCSAGA
jgi:hypothetical protein